MNVVVCQFRDFFVSLKLTVVLLALGMVLIFGATLDQVNLGVWAVQEKYFHSFFVLWRVGDIPVPVFPGGYFIGGLLLLNLVAAHLYRFKPAWRKSGIFLTHVGVILLLIGELLSGLWQQTYQMKIDQGQTVRYAEHERRYELAVIDTTDAQFDDVVAIPGELLARGEPVQHPKLPFRVVPKIYYPNAALARRPDDSTAPPSPATQGLGPQILTTPLAFNYDDKQPNIPALFVELIGPAGSLGTWLVSPDLGMPQTLTAGGRTWKLTLRLERSYKPFALTLLELRHDVYPGTDIPKNFSSRVRLATADGREDREVLIYMNNPLRYAGLTFYQYQMDNAGNYTVLQVVRNPSWQLPYVSCALVALGLLVQFGIHLTGFFGKRRAAKPAVV
jgi:hypothetical protein